jgi:hypothetical protein
LVKRLISIADPRVRDALKSEVLRELRLAV